MIGGSVKQSGRKIGGDIRVSCTVRGVVSVIIGNSLMKSVKQGIKKGVRGKGCSAKHKEAVDEEYSERDAGGRSVMQGDEWCGWACHCPIRVLRAWNLFAGGKGGAPYLNVLPTEERY